MKNKVFSVQKRLYHYEVNVFGIKLKIKSLSLAIKAIKNMQLQLKRSQIPTIYLADLSTDQKIWYLSQKFYEEVGYFPDLKNPKSFNEKINWLKLNYFNPSEEICIDKFKMKEYVATKLGTEYVIPSLGVYDDVNDIDFSTLPNKFVIKVTTSGSGEGVEVVKDKRKLNIDRIKYKFNNLLQEWNTIYYYCLSRGDKNIKPKILIEEYIDTQEPLVDYKFMCFHGEPKWVLTCSNRGKKVVYENHDLSWNLLIPSPKSSTKMTISCPKKFNQMLEIASKLSSQFPFVRVDFYEVNDKIYVGELTFTPKGGFNSYYKNWDYKIGEWLDLNKINPEYINRIF